MGGDLTNEISPIEAGLERLVDMKKGALVGREVLEDRRRATVLESEPAYDPANGRLRA
jgi:glycine cleavage system aminomethyltransferase T